MLSYDQMVTSSGQRSHGLRACIANYGKEAELFGKALINLGEGLGVIGIQFTKFYYYCWLRCWLGAMSG